MTIAYDGAAYAGWQLQPDQPTVQGTLEEALAGLLRRPVRVFGAGRTDAGVHALGQVAHFDDPTGFPVERLEAALNARLPADVRVRDLGPAPDDFHALHGAERKTYFYQLHLAPIRGGQRAVEAAVPPLRRRTFHSVSADLDTSLMRAAASHLVGRHDFTTLSKSMPPGRSPIKSVEAVRILRIPRGLRIFATADGFLYGMMRLMAGLLVEVGRRKVSPAEVPGLLQACDRSAARASLPGHGLFLWRVDYDARHRVGAPSARRRGAG